MSQSANHESGLSSNNSINTDTFTNTKAKANTNAKPATKANTNSIPNSSSASSQIPFKWVKQIRALPSDPSSNDFLKKDYIDVNLNNSRRLITNLTQLTNSSNNSVDVLTEINDNLLDLHKARNELNWLDDL